jgi:hypothetical protein
MPAAALSRFSSQVRYRDLVTLNFDRTLDRCLTGREDSKVTLRPAEHQPGQVRQTIHVAADETRVWHAHGIAGVAPSIQLGVHGYVSSCSAIVGGLAAFRERVRTWAEGRGIKRGSSWTDEHVAEWHENLRGEQTEGLQWWHVVMTSDVAFIGCGLDRAELDLWLVLHERQRQLARVPEATRPKAFYIHPWRGFPKHIASEPAGITPVVTEDHSEGWRLLFGESWG